MDKIKKLFKNQRASTEIEKNINSIDTHDDEHLVKKIDKPNKIDRYSDKRKEEYGECLTCNRYNTTILWCQTCDPHLLTRGWTSDNDMLDGLIKSTQQKSSIYRNDNYLQWVPYKVLKDVEEIGKGGFTTIYKATWINGCRYVNIETRKRCSEDRVVALKKLHNSQSISKEFLNEFKNYVKFYKKNPRIVHIYGLTQDPITKEYIFIIDYIKDGSLHDYLSKEFKTLSWSKKILILLDIIDGLQNIHSKNIIHHDLHSGNILLEVFAFIADLGLSSCPANQISSLSSSSSPNKNNIYGVLPYVAPEVLNGKPYTMASDIYSFGVLMSVMSTGQQPFSTIPHDIDLAIKICEGARPMFSNNTPRFYIELAYRCMDADPSKRSSSKKIREIFKSWYKSFDDINTIKNHHKYSDEKINEAESIRKSFDEMDKIKFDPSTIMTIIHPNAIYTSRLLKFTNLPRPVNSNKLTVICNYNGSHQIDLTVPDYQE